MGTQDGIDRLIARLAARSHGVVTRARLLAAGVTVRQIHVRIERGTLIAVHRGVYRVGHVAPSVEATYLAAVLACGPGACLGGRAAAHLLRMIDGPPPAPRVWAPTDRRIPGVITRRHRRPPPATTHRGVPTTTPARTLVDLAPTFSPDALALAFHNARVRHRTTTQQVLEALPARASGRRKLLAVLLGDVPVTLNEFEREFRRVLERAGLPLPDESNLRVHEGYVDCRYRDPPLTIELDSFSAHGDRHAWEQDRRRERAAYARGDDHRRYTYGDVFEDPSAMLAELMTLLGSTTTAPAARARSRARTATL